MERRGRGKEGQDRPAGQGGQERAPGLSVPSARSPGRRERRPDGTSARLPRHPGISGPRRPVLQAPYPPGRCLRGAPHPRTHACLCAFTQRTSSFALGAGDCQRGDGPGASVARGCQGARPRSSSAAWGGGRVVPRAPALRPAFSSKPCPREAAAEKNYFFNVSQTCSISAHEAANTAVTSNND